MRIQRTIGEKHVYKEGNKVYYENSEGKWKKYEYKDNRCIYFENSSGYFYRQMYVNGKFILFENSNGNLTLNQFGIRIRYT